MLKKNAKGWPVGFGVGDRDGVVWVTGHQYTEDGNNPDRIQVLWLFRDALCVSWDCPAKLRPATTDEARAWVSTIRNAMDRKKAEATVRCAEDCANFEGQAVRYERLFADSMSQLASTGKPERV